MNATSLQTSGGGVRRSGFWLRWTISLALVLVVEGSAISLLYRPVQATHPVQPEVIMMDLGAQPGPPPAPAPSPSLAPPRLPLAPKARPRRFASRVPAVQRPAIPDLAPSISRPELPLPQPPQTPPAAIAQPVQPVPQALPSAPPTGQVLMTWQGRLIAHLARYQRFPAQAQRRGEQGVVMMNVTLSRTGQVLSMAIATTSGHADLDAEAQAWITRADPLPAFPPEITVQQMELLIPLSFTLQ
jgi:protein TonB